MNDAVAHDSVVIERTFDAPVDLIWRLWTEPEHFKAWYGPAGATITVAEIDTRVGGRRLVAMSVQTPDGPRQMWFTGEHREVIDNARLVYTETIADENGNPLPPAQTSVPPGHPTTEVIVELHDLGGRTKMVLTHVGVPADSPGALGWHMALDKLTAHAQTISNL